MAVLWSVHVLGRCLGNFGGTSFSIWGLRIGPHSLQKLYSQHLYCCTLLSTLKANVHGFDEFCKFHGCEIVGWVSGESGCLRFPGKMTSINYLGVPWFDNLQEVVDS